ncbi:hypothetical protein LX99_00836 [Mucilaginibacter oryzae]|uniref:Uncharacterized protein n=1 Tax=Mucilaginibacter oryzae TaxID=468058 RepID=A0A316HJZ7_9SPHI|nr:hypothetical protein [Mucilaginibacter oryzae]PWK80370.1 hypothetical protein LX99_00836 [Mucilaginibacter oryzae]
MMKFNFKKSILKIPFFLILLFSIIIYSCRKGNKEPARLPAPLNDAKSWYESVYPANSGNSLQNQAAGKSRDLSQWIKPDWQHPVMYNRYGQSVIEMPVDPEAKFGSSYQLNKKRCNPAYSRSYYLLMTDGKKREAYILTIIADSAYINNDLSKLDHNTYRKHDPDFSGTILYFTPRGSYLGGYGYRNGQLMASGTEDTDTNKTPRVQNVNTGRLIANTVKQVCTDWYVVYYVDGVYQCDEYLTTTCVNVDDGNPSGSGGNTPPPPPPCPPGMHVGPPVTPPCIPLAVESVEGGNRLKTNYVPPPPPPGDGGMPPPTAQVCSVDPPRQPCPSAPDPCELLKKAKQKFATAFNTQRNADVLAKPGTNEYGSNLNLTSLSANTYMNTPITTNGTNSWMPNFTWNSTNGFSIGSVHRHQSAGPSPNDVFSLIDHLSNPDLVTSGASSIKFYRDNAYATIVSNTTTYTVTVSNWAILSQMFLDYNQDRNGYEEAFQNKATEYKNKMNLDEASATNKALMEIFSGAINLYKSPSNSTNYVITDIDKNGKLTITTCPDK